MNYSRAVLTSPSRERLDRRLRRDHPALSWTRLRAAIEKGQVTVAGRPERDPAATVGATDAVVLDLNRPAARIARSSLPLLFEDDHVLVVDKPAGLLSVPAHPGRTEDTVLARVRDYMVHRRGAPGYVGALHRLDRETSGALAVALSAEAHAAGRALFSAHRFHRQYLALVRGVPTPPRGTIDAPIADAYVSGRRRMARGGDAARDAVTHYHVRERFGDRAALVELTLDTGRQHQIRLHLQRLGHPVLGDRVYGGDAATAAPRQMLHAWRLAFPHPLTGTAIAVDAPLPDDFARLMRRLAAR
ncbi:MAG: RluA family pseudouridine synthase [Vicinamibacterales bacterium]